MLEKKVVVNFVLLVLYWMIVLLRVSFVIEFRFQLDMKDIRK